MSPDEFEFQICIMIFFINVIGAQNRSRTSKRKRNGFTTRAKKKEEAFSSFVV